MAFTIIANSTTANPDEPNDNFLFIAQGSVLPRGGAGLVATTGVNDLGSAAVKWNNTYCKNLNTAGDIKDTNGRLLKWNLINENTAGTSTSRIEITGLNGNYDKQYLILTRLIADTTTTVKLYYNGDSTAANYHNWAVFDAGCSQTAGTVAGGITNITGGQTTTGDSLSFARHMVSAESGGYKFIKSWRCDDAIGATVNNIVESSCGYLDTINTTSLVFEITGSHTSFCSVIWRMG